MIGGEKANGFGGGGEQLRDPLGILFRSELGQTIRAGGRQRQAPDDFDDLLEAEGPESACLHRAVKVLLLGTGGGEGRRDTSRRACRVEPTP